MAADAGTLYRHAGMVLIRATTDPGGLTLPDDLNPFGDGDAEAESAHTWLAQVWWRDEVREAIHLASPTLSRQVDEMMAGQKQDARTVRRIVVSLASYLLRWQRRPTPFGLFAGMAVVTIGRQPVVRWGEDHRTVARADAQWLGALVDRLEWCPDLLKRLPVVANGAAFVRGDRLVVPGQPSGARPGQFAALEVSVRYTRPVRATLEAARAPVPFGELVKVLCGDFPAASPQQIRTMLAELIAQGILVTGLRTPMTVPDALGHVCAQLEAANAEELPEVADTAAELWAIRDDLSRLSLRCRLEDRVRRSRTRTGDSSRRRNAGTRHPQHPRTPCDLPLEPSRPTHPDSEHPRADGARGRSGPTGPVTPRSPRWWWVMWPEPGNSEVIARMRTAHAQARAALEVLPAANTYEAWGWRGRTLSHPVTTPHGPAWLRVACAPIGEVAATFWNGSIEAEKAMPSSVPRPRLRLWHDWNDQHWEYRAELYDHAPTRPAATSPVLTTVLDLPAAWWAAVRATLDDLAAVRTSRRTIHQSFLDHAMPRLLGTPIDTTAPRPWTTAHGDFHFANISAPTLCLFDFEGWGLAPAGYDAAMLHSYSLLVPPITAQIRTELTEILNTPSGRFAELAVITELLYATTRGDHLALDEPLRRRASHILGRTVPALT